MLSSRFLPHLALIFAAVAAPAFAFDPPHGVPAVSIVQPADYLCAIVSIRSTAKDTERQATAVQESMRRITTAVQRSNTFQLHQGPARFFGGSNNANSLFSKPSYNPLSLQTNLRILCPLTPDADFFETIRQLTQFVAAIPLPGESEVKIISATLAVASAEQRRDRLMQLIREQIATTRAQLGANVVTVTGLDSPVLVRQLDNLSVELFLDYQLSATLEK
ncbi:MAG: hypothetical protein H7343_04205 [Undibacterium sp.]|nr:hypothetical protein [Opitutaceae bacterium]